jgi:tetratricopeptide (TPR) repeat protein
MRRVVRAVLGCTAAYFLSVASPAVAQTSQAQAWCFGNDSTDDETIAGCTQVIPLAYADRGFAYRNKGDLDRAIADDSEAIRLNPKFVLAYNDRGRAYLAKGDLDRAIADYSEAIRLDPKFVLAYNDRGLAYATKGDLDRAIADYTEAIRLDPKIASAYNNRGYAYATKGDNDRAIADYSEAIRLDPKLVMAYYNRGRENLFAGTLPKALADLNQASELNPKNAFAALWLDIVNKRSNLPSRLAETTKQIDMTKWPAPVIRLYMGQLTPEAVLAAADDTDPTVKRGHVCEANFYSGELVFQQGNKDEATRLFRLAVADCPKDSIAYESANAELKALGTSPPSPPAESSVLERH